MDVRRCEARASSTPSAALLVAGLLLGGLCLAFAALRPRMLAQDVLGPLMVDVILTMPGVLIALHVV
jgi:hypothetical protein